jgi:hypothetical protein
MRVYYFLTHSKRKLRLLHKIHSSLHKKYLESLSDTAVFCIKYLVHKKNLASVRDFFLIEIYRYICTGLHMWLVFPTNIVQGMWCISTPSQWISTFMYCYILTKIVFFSSIISDTNHVFIFIKAHFLNCFFFYFNNCLSIKSHQLSEYKYLS